MQVAAKLGIWVVIGLFVKIDVCLKLLLVNLNICIGGILVLIVKGYARFTCVSHMGFLRHFYSDSVQPP